MIASTLFGPEYVGSQPETVGIFKMTPNSRLDVTFGGLAVLPAGGYVVKHVSGFFILADVTPITEIVGGSQGLCVEWAAIGASAWTRVEYLTREDIKGGSLFYIEFTTPHRMRLVSPRRVLGSTMLEILKYSRKEPDVIKIM